MKKGTDAPASAPSKAAKDAVEEVKAPAAPSADTVLAQLLIGQQEQSTKMISALEAISGQQKTFSELHQAQQRITRVTHNVPLVRKDPVYHKDTIYLIDTRPTHAGKIIIYTESILHKVGKDYDIWIPDGCTASDCTASLDLYNGLNAVHGKSTEAMDRTELLQYIGRRKLAMESSPMSMEIDELRAAVNAASALQKDAPPTSRTSLVQGSTGRTISDAIAAEHGAVPVPGGGIPTPATTDVRIS